MKGFGNKLFFKTNVANIIMAASNEGTQWRYVLEGNVIRDSWLCCVLGLRVDWREGRGTGGLWPLFLCLTRSSVLTWYIHPPCSLCYPTSCSVSLLISFILSLSLLVPDSFICSFPPSFTHKTEFTKPPSSST